MPSAIPGQGVRAPAPSVHSGSLIRAVTPRAPENKQRWKNFPGATRHLSRAPRLSAVSAHDKSCRLSALRERDEQIGSSQPRVRRLTGRGGQSRGPGSKRFFTVGAGIISASIKAPSGEQSYCVKLQQIHYWLTASLLFSSKKKKLSKSLH